MRVKAILSVDEDTLKKAYANTSDDYSFDEAFSSEMHWVGDSGISLDNYEVIEEEDLPMSKQARTFAFFSFRTNKYAGGFEGTCRGMVNVKTGEITANIYYGSMSYSDTIKCNVSDKVSDFTCTEKDFIILAARKSLER